MSPSCIPGATVGFLQQEPELDPAKDVRGNVEDGVRQLRDLLDRFNAISAAFAEPDADFDALLAEQAEVQDQIERHDALEPRRHARPRDGRAAAPRGRPRRDDPVGRRAPARRALPAAALLAGPAPARRADEPPRRRVRRLARALSRGLQGHGDGGHPRPLLPRQRGRLDPRARPWQGAAVPGATTRRGSSRSRRGSPSRRRPSRPGGARSPASSSGCA